VYANLKYVVTFACSKYEFVINFVQSHYQPRLYLGKSIDQVRLLSKWKVDQHVKFYF